MKKILAALLSVALLLPAAAVQADTSFLTAYTAATANGQYARIYPLVGQSVCAVDLENTFVGTAQFQGLVNTSWQPLLATPLNAAGPSSLTMSTTGIYTAPCAGLRSVQVIVTAFTSGEMDISLNAAPGDLQNNGQTVSVGNSSPIPVSVSSFPTPVANQSVTVTNTPAVTVQNFPSPVPYPSNQAVTVTNTPGVTVQNTPSVTVANTPAVTVVNFPTPVPNQNVTVTNTPSVSISYSGASYKVLTTAGTVVVKAGAGIYYGESSLGGTIDQVTVSTCYDNATTGSGQVLSATALVHNTVFALPFGVAFTNGLTCVVPLLLLGNGIAEYYR